MLQRQCYVQTVPQHILIAAAAASSGKESLFNSSFSVTVATFSERHAAELQADGLVERGQVGVGPPRARAHARQLRRARHCLTTLTLILQS